MATKRTSSRSKPTARAKAAKPRAARAKPANKPRKPATEPPAERALAVTTFRVYRDQLMALKHRALERTADGGRADASAVLRDLLDEILDA